MSAHKNLTDNHRLESYVFANAGARAAGTGYTFAGSDVGRIAYQTDTGGYYRVLSVTGGVPTWLAVGGGGGGSGQIGRQFTAPSTAGFTWYNQDSTTLTTLQSGFQFSKPGTPGVESNAVYTTAIPAAPFFLAAYILPFPGAELYERSGLCLHLAGSQVAAQFHYAKTTRKFYAAVWTGSNYGSFSQDLGSFEFNDPPYWQAIQDTGSAYRFLVSRDGLVWQTLVQFGSSGTYDRIGFLIGARNDEGATITAPSIMSCYSFGTV